MGEMVAYGMAGTATWAVLAVLLWGATSRRFRQIAGRVAFEPERGVRPAPRAKPRPKVVEVEEAPEVLPADPEPLSGDTDEDRITGPQLP